MNEKNGVFTKKIATWFKRSYRNLPWKQVGNPYYTYISEIVLQQTQVKQGMPFYLKLIKNYPTVFDMAKAPIEQILKDWEGLGYYSRARNMHYTAKYVVEHYNGKFPNTYEGLLTLKGVGEYTAAAIASFAFNIPKAVVDGNVIRVLSRYFGVFEPAFTSQGKKAMQALADSLIDKTNPADYNQAIMDFGATVCTPKKPSCTECVFNTSCYAYLNNKVTDLPIKKPALVKKNRYFLYHVYINANQQTLIQQRQAKDIWQSLFNFPLVEVNTKNNYKQHVIVKQFSETPFKKQVLSHQNIWAKFIIIKVPKLPKIEGCKTVNIKNLDNFAFPRIIRLFIEDYL